MRENESLKIETKTSMTPKIKTIKYNPTIYHVKLDQNPFLFFSYFTICV